MADPPFYLRTGTSGEQVIGTPGNVLTIMADGKRVQGQPPGGGGGTLVNLANTVWVDALTSVAPADQTGNIEAPFDSLADGEAYLALLANDEPKCMVIMPGDYSGEAEFEWNAADPTHGRIHMVNGSWLGQQLNKSFQDVLMPVLEFAGIVYLTGLKLTDNVSCNGSLFLTSCEQLAGALTAGDVQATNCYLNQAIALTDSGSYFRQCTTGPITAAASEGELRFQDCYIGGNVTMGGDPGTVLIDGVSEYYFLANGRTLTNGTMVGMTGGRLLAQFIGESGAAANDFINPQGEAHGTESRSQVTFPQPRVIKYLSLSCVGDGGSQTDVTLTVRVNGVNKDSITIAQDTAQAVKKVHIPVPANGLVSVQTGGIIFDGLMLGLLD